MPWNLRRWRRDKLRKATGIDTAQIDPASGTDESHCSFRTFTDGVNKPAELETYQVGEGGEEE
jgi:hypothetical protein